MITTEGLNYMLNVSVKGASPISTWYAFPFKGDYTPTPADVAATFPTLSTESTAYVGATRPAVTFGTVAGGEVDNSAALLQIEANATETWYGVGVISTPTKGATSGTLLHVQRFPAPHAMTSGSKLELLIDVDLNQPA